MISGSELHLTGAEKKKDFVYQVSDLDEPGGSELSAAAKLAATRVKLLYMRKFVLNGVMEEEDNPDLLRRLLDEEDRHHLRKEV